MLTNCFGSITVCYLGSEGCFGSKKLLDFLTKLVLSVALILKRAFVRLSATVTTRRPRATLCVRHEMAADVPLEPRDLRLRRLLRPLLPHDGRRLDQVHAEDDDQCQPLDRGQDRKQAAAVYHHSGANIINKYF